ncbi:hypothetical protein ACIQZG_19080 [Lysinibacillus sp. NPDC096418]
MAIDTAVFHLILKISISNNAITFSKKMHIMQLRAFTFGKEGLKNE